MPGQNILIVEDDRKTAELLSEYLEFSDFIASLLDHGDHVVHEVKLHPPDLIILDIMLPGKDGISICRELRSFSNVPILILSAKVDESDRILGLESGADDYICKPFSPKEVIARINAILRRKPFIEMIENKIDAGPITINPDSHNATISGKNLNLTLIEFELLKLMASMPNNVFTRNDLISMVRRNEISCSERIIDTHIKNLRNKLDQCLQDNNLINTVYGMGYSLRVPQRDNVPIALEEMV